MKHYKGLAAIAAMAFLCAGCGRQDVKVDEPSTTSAPVMWKTEGFAVNDEVMEEQELWVDRHIKWEHNDVKLNEQKEEIFNPVELGVIGDSIYRFSPISEPPELSPVRGVMERIDTSSMEKSVTVLTPEQMGAESEGSGYIVDMDVNGDNEYVFQWVSYGNNDSGNIVQRINKLVHIDENGEKKETDLLPVYLEKGLSLEKYKNIELGGECVCDASGNSYVRGEYFDSLFVLDMEGKLLLEYICSNDEQINEPMKTEEGEVIYPCYDRKNKTTRLLWADVENGNVKTLATIDGDIIQLYGMKGNELYYENNDGIVRWDIASGERKLIFAFNENGVQNVYRTQLVIRNNAAPVLRMYGWVNEQFEDWLMVMSEQPVEKADPVRVVSLTKVSDRVRSCVSIAARHNPDFSYKYEDGNGMDASDFYTRVMAEMTSGAGPDILYVSAENMEILSEKGLLADLREYIPEETLKKVIPGVLELGTLNGTLTGMAADIEAWSLMLQDDVWRGESWTLDDMISLLESGKISGRLLDGDTLHASKIAFRILLQYLLDDSFIIDWENNESHFEDERFVKLIKYMGNYRTEQCDGEQSQADGGMRVAAISYVSEVNDYSGVRGNKGWHYVGFPSGHGCGNYIDAHGMVVVNANTTSKEAVAAYLECLLGKDVQDIDTYGSGLSVLPLSTDDIGYYEDKPLWNGYELRVFADGSTSLDEVNELLAKCVPGPRTYAEIEDIVWEEIQSYYSGDKTAEEVAALIDDRVQLYLDEMR